MTETLKKVIFLIVFALFSTIPSIASITAQFGHPLYTAFEPEDYHGEGQSFDIAVNSENLIYVANSGGVIEYDGQEWRLIEGTLNRIPLAIDIDSLDRVWVALRNDPGVLVADSTGKLYFTSLLPEFPDSLDLSTGIWRVRATSQGIFYMSPRWLIRWMPSNDDPLVGEYTYWDAGNNSYSMCCEVNGRVYIRRSRMSIQEIVGDSLHTVEAWKEGTNNATIVHVLPFDDHTVLLTSYHGHFLLADSSGVRRMPGEVQDVVEGAAIFGVTRLSEDRFVSASNQGAVVFNKQGDVLETITSLGDLSLFNINRDGDVDHGGGVWFPLNYGLVRIELNRPHRVFDGQSGLDGSIMQIYRSQGTLYVGTTSGLYYLPAMDSPGMQPKFKQVKGFSHAIRQMAQVGNRLFITTMRGFYYIEGAPESGAKEVGHYIGNQTALAVSEDGHYLYVGTELEGVRLYENLKSGPVDRGQLDVNLTGFDRSSIYQDNAWTILRGGGRNKIYAATFEEETPNKLEFKHYGENEGLLGEPFGAPLVWRDSLYVITREGLFRYRSQNDQFEPYLVPFPVSLKDAFMMNAPPIDKNNWIYLSIGAYRTVRVDLTPGSDHKVEELMQRSRIRRVFDIYPDPQTGLIVLGGDDGRLFFMKAPTTPPRPEALLREIRLNDDDSIYLHTRSRFRNTLTEQGPLSSIRFIYTLTSYDATEANEFQYRLVGRDEEWSEWTNETYRDFNDLREGVYRFEVRGRDYTDTISDPASFTFTVLPPWYRTPWMLLIWALLAIGLVYLVVMLRTRQLAQQQLKLEALVRQRTQELQEAQAAEIREIEARKAAEYETNRLKHVAQLATTIAHELNNPLAVIQGRIEVAEINTTVDPVLKNAHDSIRDQVDRMSGLVERLCGIESIRVVDYAGGIKMLDLEKNREQDGTQKNHDSEDNENDQPS